MFASSSVDEPLRTGVDMQVVVGLQVVRKAAIVARVNNSLVIAGTASGKKLG